MYTVYGHPMTATFQACVEAAEHVNKEYSEDYHITVCQEMPRDFSERQANMLAAGQISDTNWVVIVVDEDGNTQSGVSFLTELQQRTSFKLLSLDPTHPDSYENRAMQTWRTFLRLRGNQYCWMDVKIGDHAVGRVTFELYAKVVPFTCGNFLRLCAGASSEPVQVPESTQPISLTYKGSTFFRVLKEAWVMGGDITPSHSGNSGYSSFGRYFTDESYTIPHDAPGVLGMANDGPHTNASSFYITRKALPWMNGRYVAFGRVVDGMEVVDAIHGVEVKHNQGPRETILIADCGVLDVDM